MPHDHHYQPLPDTELRVRALESILQEQGLLDQDVTDVLVDTYETKRLSFQKVCEGDLIARKPAL